MMVPEAGKMGCVKRLILLRHAKSGDDLVERDFDRQLSRRGQRAAMRIGQWFADEAMNFDAVIASPAQRVRETIESVERGIGFGLEPRFEPRIYLASAAAVLDAVLASEDRGGTLLLIELTDLPLKDVMFETTSAFATVGLSTGITPEIGAPGQAVLTFLMFLGRLGPITLVSALALRENTRRYTLPEGAPLIG